MPKKFKGTNTKVQAANERKEAAQAVKNAKSSAEREQQAAKEWAVGGNARAAKKAQEDELKRQAQDAKLAEKKRMEAQDAANLQGVKNVRTATKKTKAMKAVDKPWEAALAPVAKKKGSGLSRRQMMKQKEDAVKKSEEEDLTAPPEVFEGLAPAIGLEKNRNRDISDNSATTIDAALDLLSVKDGGEKHPEKRAKAAYKAWEEVQMPLLKVSHPGLKRSQYKERLSAMWSKSPDNPLNQESLAYNQKKK